MHKHADNRVGSEEFQPVNQAYNSTFHPNRLSLGLVVPLETYTMSAVPTMAHHVERVQLAEELGFSAVWLRDVPFNVPSFGDAGQMFDPFIYLGLLAGQTERIALGVASIILPLRHPAHVAKAAASVESPKAKEVFDHLATEEQNHFALLKNTYDFMADPEGFDGFDGNAMLDGG